jgi:glycosyltransferase involved in cell wall biosynthesis
MGLYKSEKDVLIIMPAHNEENAIEDLLVQLEQPEFAKFADLLVINDASTDTTSMLVKKHRHMRVTHLYHLGYGSALQVGYKYAVRRRYKYVIQMDADGQHDLCNIHRIYERLEAEDAPDIVLGSRFLEQESNFPVSRVKRLAYWLFRHAIRWFTGHEITDPTTGLQGLSRRAVLYYSKYNQFDFTYPDANMIMQMLLLGFRVEEVPAVMHPRQSGTSMHCGLRPFVYMFQMSMSILAVWFRIRVLGEGEAVDQIVDIYED